MTRKSSGGWTETLKTIVYAVLIAVVVRTVAFEPFNIPSGSMIPTLLVGDYLFVSKYSYGYSRYSLPFGLPLIPGRIFASAPERGDVVVFKLPRDNKTDYIKRIVGLPGDKIQVKSGILHVNGEPVKREPIDDLVLRDGYGNEQRFKQYMETLPGGRKHRIIELSDNQPRTDETQVYTVPAGQLFAMGDNRDNSQDSRFVNDVGYVPMENLVGRAEILFFSTDGTAYWWEFWRWLFAIRYDRLFQGIK
ncbi:MAG: signal peptidase I [Rhodospirillales bacterium]